MKKYYSFTSNGPIFILGLIIAMLFFTSAIGFAQSAIGQLESITGKRIDRSSGSSVTSDNTANRQAWAEYRQNQREARQLQKLNYGIELNQAGINEYTLKNWAAAIKYFKKALRNNPHDVIRKNLQNAEDNYAKEKASEKLRTETQKKLREYEDEQRKLKEEKEKKEMEQQQVLQKAVTREQNEFEVKKPAWVKTQKENIEKRLEKPNSWSNGIYNSLKNNAPPLPYKKFDELEAGDVILFAPRSGDLGGAVVTDVSNFGQNSKESTASHTVTYLKEVKGKKLFLDNMPGEGPQIISEDQLLKKYENRDAEVAKLSYYGVAQPLKPAEAQKLYESAIELARSELASETKKAGNLFDKTNYGVIGKENMVCSEASWTLIKSTGRDIPMSKSWITRSMGVDFSPADFYNNTQYFLVTPLSMSR